MCGSVLLEGETTMDITDPMLLRQIIMDHYQYPRNKHAGDDHHNHMIHMASESCIDDIKVWATIENVKITDICFDGVACTISTASTSILTELLKGKSLTEAKVLIDRYFDMIDLKNVDLEPLEEAIAFYQVGKQANRIKCATIGWNAMKQIIEESEGKHD
jgi:nitrogen fixation protein NifU and related proteins